MADDAVCEGSRRSLTNAYFACTVFIISCGSIPKGYDEGGFSAALELASFRRDFGLLPGQWRSTASELASRKATIASLGVLGAAVGAIVAVAVTDRIGRLRAWQSFALLWMAGFLTVTMSSGNVGLLMFARLWSGVGAGGLAVVSPLYLSEIAKAKNRGMVVSVYMVTLLSSLMIGFFINYAALKTMAPSRQQYRTVLAVPQMPVGIALVASFFLHDTPRWLASRRRPVSALVALAKLHGRSLEDAEIQEEFEAMQSQIRDKDEMLVGTSTWTILREVATVPSYRSRFLLGATMQTFAQWSGGNGITYYIPHIFQLAGIADDKLSLVASGAYGAVKLVFTMLFTWGLVDFFGRRCCFLVGLAVQCATHAYMATYMAVWRSGTNTAASDAAVASVFVYAVGWSVGLCTVQYLYGTEILPTRVRGVCYAVNMTLHWLFQFAVMHVTPAMLLSLDVWGAFAFWACVCALGLVLLGLWALETKAVPMERMAELFSGPWYRDWRASVRELPKGRARGGVGATGGGWLRDTVGGVAGSRR